MLTLRASFLLLAVPIVAAACSTQTILVPSPAKPVEDAGAVDQDADIPADDGATGEAAVDSSDPVNPNYPAPHAPIPLVDFNGGGVMKNPKIVTVTWGNDSFRSRLEQFGDTITATPWWDAVREGYCSPPGGATCIGRGSGGGHVNIAAAPPSSFTDSANGGGSTIQTFLLAQIQNGTLPVPTTDTLYALYLPSGVSVSLDGATSCHQFGGYHNTLTYARAGLSDIPVPYAIMPRCDSRESTLTIAASHEFIEAATDPDVGTNGVAYYMQNQLWAFAGGEVGDVCVDFTGAGSDTIQESGFTVQRSWSNTAAKASHDPCVPAPAPSTQPYFNASPKVGQEKLKLAVGESAVIELDAFSDGPMADWSLSAVDFDQFQTGTSHLQFTFDKTTVHNGSKVNLTVKLASAPTQGGSLYAIISRSGKTTHLWPAAVIKK